MAMVKANSDLDLLDIREVAAILGVSKRTVERLQLRKAGPPLIRIGKRWRYRRVSFEAWLRAQEQPAR